MNLFKALGFRWDRSAILGNVPTHTIERVCFHVHKLLAEFVWNTAALNGSSFTFVEIKTLLDGVTVGGHKVSEQEQILKLIAAHKRLLHIAKSDQFELNGRVFSELNGIVTGKQVPEQSLFYGFSKEKIFNEGVAALNESEAFERAVVFFLFSSLQKFFKAGNQSTAFIMMNGILMSNGINALNVPGQKAQEFNTRMNRFYASKDGTEMIDFFWHCHIA